MELQSVVCLLVVGFLGTSFAQVLTAVEDAYGVAGNNFIFDWTYTGTGSLNAIDWYKGSVATGVLFMTYDGTTTTIDPGYQGKVEYVNPGPGSAALKLLNLAETTDTNMYTIQLLLGGNTVSESSTLLGVINGSVGDAVPDEDIEITVAGKPFSGCQDGTLDTSTKSIEVAVTIKPKGLRYETNMILLKNQAETVHQCNVASCSFSPVEINNDDVLGIKTELTKVQSLPPKSCTTFTVKAAAITIGTPEESTVAQITEPTPKSNNSNHWVTGVVVTIVIIILLFVIMWVIWVCVRRQDFMKAGRKRYRGAGWECVDTMMSTITPRSCKCAYANEATYSQTRQDVGYM